MSKLDFNRAPYFDDFVPEKNYMSILFQPGRPVQGRELNQIQSSFRGQIEKFANHMFKNGSKISNGRSSLTAKSYVRLLDTLPTNSAVQLNLTPFPEGTKVVGAVSGINAVLVKAINKEDGDPPTIFVVYTSTAIDGVTTNFIPGEQINFYDENNIIVYSATVRCPTCPGSGLSGEIAPVGNGQLFTVDEGIFYYEGMFIESARQSMVVNKYITKDGSGNLIAEKPCKIGFDFVQTIVSSSDDPSLLDPSLGYPNSTAPGADRYQVELKLVKRDYAAEDGDNFILLCRVGEGMRIEYLKSESEYSDILDTLAKRTYEQAGNYTIRPFKVSFFESKKVSSSDSTGWSLNGNKDNVIALVTPSVAYVKGYRVETISDTPIEVSKARDTKQISSFIKRFDERTYITLRPTSDAVWPNARTDSSTMSRNVVQIYDGPVVAGNVSGTNIGSFKVSDIYHVSGNPVAHTAVYRYYIYDLNITVSGKKLSNAKSFVNTDALFVANGEVDTTTTKLELYNANRTPLIFKIDRDNVKSLRDVDNSANGSISVVVRKKLTATLDSNGTATFSSASNEFFESYSGTFVAWAHTVGGTPVALNLTSSNVTIDPTTMTVNTGAANAGRTLTIIADVLRTNQKEKTKTLTLRSFTTSTAPNYSINAEVALARADAWRVVSITVVNPSDGSFVPIDVTSEYKLVANITDIAYNESKIVRIKAGNIAIDSNHRLLISFEYFEHSGTTGYFTIDSYGGPFNDVASGVTYEKLPVYTSLNKNVYPPQSSFDFRPIVIGTEAIVSIVPANNSTAIFDIEYYLARTDLIQVNKEGRLYSKAGVPSETPRPPKPDDDSMALYEVWFKPYTYSLKDISTKFIENRRYTMRDIGDIEHRLKNVEYYTALNLLEKSAADMAIKDAAGFDRFKNGFIADNFADFQAGDLTNVEFKASVDRGVRELRPKFKTRNTKLVANKILSTGVRWHGNVATRPYTEALFDTNPFATKHLSINPFFQFNKKGTVVLSPNVDTWTEDRILPRVVTNINTGVESFAELASASGVLGTDWGSWIDQNRTILGTVRDTAQAATAVLGGLARTTTVTSSTTAATTQARSGVNRTVESRSQSYTIDDIVKDVQVIPYIRASVVEFYASRLKPNTVVYPFFDGIAVAAHCRDIGFQLSVANETTRKALIAYGTPLVTDANGDLRGEFSIPAGKFFTGEKTFILTDDPGLTGDPDLVSTTASGTYFAGGLDVTKQDSTLNIITPTFNSANVSQTRTIQTVSTVREVSVNVTPSQPIPTPVQPTCAAPGGVLGFNGILLVSRTCACATDPSSPYCTDPVAQAFLTAQEIVLTSYDIFLKQVDPLSDLIFAEVRNMVNGYPGPMVLGRKEYKSTELAAFVSNDSTVPFNVKFDVPIYLEANTQYCIVIGGYSPNTRIWVSRLGQQVVNIPGKTVDIPPVDQVSFRSLNGSTWNAEQFEVLKYNLYAAKFEVGEMKVVFENDSDLASVSMDDSPLEMQTGSNRVRVYMMDHGFVENDKVDISLIDSSEILIETSGLPPQVGQLIHTVTGQGVITSITSDSSVNYYRIKVKKTSGVFLNGQQYTADSKVRALRDNYILGAIGAVGSGTFTLNEALGYFRENSYLTKYPTGFIGGIPVQELNGQHTVATVDSQDSFIVEMVSVASNSGRFGGTDIKTYGVNTKYELFNISGSYITYGAAEDWSLVGLGHGRTGTLFETDDYIAQDKINFFPGHDRYLAKPFKIASSANEVRVLGVGKSLVVETKINNQTAALSPFINSDTFSFTNVSNRAEWISTADFNQIPNASGRFIAETNSLLGSETYKYVTKNVLLKDPANDIHIFFDVYKDLNADFDVYIKRVSVYETRGIDELEWLKADLIVKNKSSVDLTDRIEYEIIGSEHITGWLDGSGSPEPFIGFRVKIIGRSRNSAKPPTFRSFRGIAVT